MVSSHIEFLAEAKRDRFLQAGEMPAFWKALDEEPSEDYRDFLMLSLLAGARSGNTRAMRWDELDLQAAEWRVTDAESKNGEPMRLILVPEALEVLERRRTNSLSPWVFPAESKSGQRYRSAALMPIDKSTN